ncbi:MAG: ABC transporter permease, partial [Pyrinomonadaceae bacterium]|nr:ABC transporter permease [Pyrinomonadaceae bacterium]
MTKKLACPKCAASMEVDSDGPKLRVCSFCGSTVLVEDVNGEPQLRLDESGVFESSSGQLVAGASLWKDAWKRLLKNKLAVFGMIVLGVMLIAVTIGPAIIRWATGFTPDYIPSDIGDGEFVKSFPPSLQHPMGTDDQGRDLLARVLQGGRISLMVGIISTIVSLIVGVSWGAVAGYMGGRIDNIMMRIVDSIYAIPFILIVIVLLSVFGGPNTPEFIKFLTESFGRSSNAGLNQIFLMFFALGLVSWLTMARVVRGQVLSLKNQEFVLAAKATGVSTFGI